MKRIMLRLAIGLVTFMLGVASTSLWLRHQSSVTKIEVNNVVESPMKVVRVLPILTFCELASNSDKYNGKIVRVSARLSGYLHGMLFYGPTCWEGEDTRVAVSYNSANRAEIECDLRRARGSDNWLEPVDIIATGIFRKVTPSNESDTIYDTASLQFEIIQIESASKVR
jgi:hypothetical protein